MMEPDKVQHIYPLDEEDQHILFLTYTKSGQEYSQCSCEPWFRVLPNGNTLVVHSSFNGREGVEWANEILNNKTDKK